MFRNSRLRAWRYSTNASVASPAAAELPIEGVLDLHPFRPLDVKVLLTEYLIVFRERGIFEVRVIHGKGIGELRRTVHVLLGRMPDVDRYAFAGEHYGGSGTTMVRLKPLGKANAAGVLVRRRRVRRKV